MRSIKVISIILGSVILIGIIFLWYIGAFASMQVQEKTSGQYIIAGQLFTGPYYKVGDPMEKVDSILRTIGVNSTRGFGIYYDDPKSTPKEKCRSFVGNIIESSDLNKLKAIQLAGIKLDTIEDASSLIIDFPTRTKLAYMVGPMKAYPALVEYATAKKYNATMVLEIYDMPKRSTLFIMQYKK